MSQRPDADSSDSDPLLLFATEPQKVVAPAQPVEIPKEIDPAPASPETAALLHRAETAERLLRDSRREAALLKRQVATLVGAAGDNRVKTVRPALILTLAATCLVALGTVAFRSNPAAAPADVATAEPKVEAAVQALPITNADPVAGTDASVALPRRDAPARTQQRVERPPVEQFVGTLSVDAVPAGGEVFINRKSVGTTPVRLNSLRAGSHLVWIQLEGYRRFTRVVLVPANKVSRVSVALEPEIIAAVRP